MPIYQHSCLLDIYPHS